MQMLEERGVHHLRRRLGDVAHRGDGGRAHLLVVVQEPVLEVPGELFVGRRVERRVRGGDELHDGGARAVAVGREPDHGRVRGARGGLPTGHPPVHGPGQGRGGGHGH